MHDYVPRPDLAGGHRMTIYVWARPRHFPRLPRPTVRLFDVGPETRVVAACHWQPDPRSRPTLVALHGLEGSSDAPYMRGLADKGYAAGFNVVRLNQRNCGRTEHLSAGLYHSGLTADLLAVIREIREIDGVGPVAVAGYSLGGNLALKLAGELGGDARDLLSAVAAVSPTLDLARCVDALERPENALYQWNFMRHLRRRMRLKARLFPDRYEVGGIGRVRTVRAFDDRFTAPHHGFRDAADYYHRASALRVADRIRIPALVLAAEDDPFVPADQFRDPALGANPNVTVVLTPRGGHCGFLAAASNGFDGYWAERTIVSFALVNG